MNKKITAYKIVSADYSTDLSREVNAAINDGWQPLGGPVSNNNDSELTLTFSQALVKYEE